MPAANSPESKRRVAELVRQGDKPIPHLAKELGIAEFGLRRWVAQAGVDEGHRPGLTSDERKELAQLRRRNCVLEMENEMLRRDAACFAMDAVLPK